MLTRRQDSGAGGAGDVARVHRLAARASESLSLARQRKQETTTRLRSDNEPRGDERRGDELSDAEPIAGRSNDPEQMSNQLVTSQLVTSQLVTSQLVIKRQRAAE